MPSRSSVRPANRPLKCSSAAERRACPGGPRRRGQVRQIYPWGGCPAAPIGARRITTAGAVTEFSGLPPESYPDGIAAGPDGDLWFTESLNSRVARMTRSGQVIGFYPTTEFGGDRVARMTFNPPVAANAQ